MNGELNKKRICQNTNTQALKNTLMPFLVHIDNGNQIVTATKPMDTHLA
jgi:hypothetical protein